MYSIKNLKTMTGRDGEAFSATLYRGTTKVAQIINEGCGGMTDVDFYGDSRAHRQRMEDEFATWVRANCADHWISQHVSNEHGDGPVALGAEMLVEREQERRILARHAKTKVLLRLPQDTDGSYRTLAHRGSPEAAVAALRVKYPEAVFYSPTTGLWA